MVFPLGQGGLGQLAEQAYQGRAIEVCAYRQKRDLSRFPLLFLWRSPSFRNAMIIGLLMTIAIIVLRQIAILPQRFIDIWPHFPLV